MVDMACDVALDSVSMLALKLIRQHYSGRLTKRSRVPLINHVHEGLAVMWARRAPQDAMAAYCLHPLFQDDMPLRHAWYVDKLALSFPSSVVMLVMEYRNIANNYLLPLKANLYQSRAVKLSPLHLVNEMLIADKVQNRKDFRIYHAETHRHRSALGRYFEEWLNALGVDSDEEKRLLEAIETYAPMFKRL